MKAKFKLFSLVALMTGSLVCLGQDSIPADQTEAQPQSDTIVQPAPASSESSSAPAAAAEDAPAVTPESAAAAEPAVEPAATVELAQAAEPAEMTGAATSGESTEMAQPDESESAAPDASAEAMANETDASASEPGSADEVIPLIVMEDVGLIDAIKNLARQAGLNYQFDPKVPYGGVGPDGTPRPEPQISIRWENLTAQQALTALLNNYSLVIVDDPKTSTTRITVKDPEAPEPLLTQPIQLKFSSPSNMVPIVQASLTDSRSKVLADTRSSQLVVVATEAEIKTVTNLVEQLDKSPKQVLIEAKLIETSTSPKTSKGIDWSSTLSAQNVTFGNGISSGTFTTTTPGASTTTTLPGGRTTTRTAGSSQVSEILSEIGGSGVTLDTVRGFNPAIGFLNADGVHAVLSFINNNSDARVISEPRTVTLDNETAKLSVTRATPIFKNTAGTQGSPGGSEVTYTNLGTILNVTPRISANDYIQLHVVPEVSSVFETVKKTVADTVNEADVYDIRRIETRVLIPSGNTLVLGGLMQDSMKNASSKVPVFGDIPILGHAFRHKSKEQDKSNLLIFITPTIVEESDFKPTESTFMKAAYQGTSVNNLADEKWGTFDSTEPYDWSKR